jgi:hypothetical protein
LVGVHALLQQVALAPHCTPHAPQSLVVFSAWHWPWQQAPEAPHQVTHAPQEPVSARVSTQRPVQHSRPEPHGLVALQAGVQEPPTQTLPAAHWASTVHIAQERFGRHTPEGQSVPVLQPRSQVKSLRQYSPIGHVSFDGRHCTHRLLATSHCGVAPLHCALVVHCTHWPAALHT